MPRRNTTLVAAFGISFLDLLCSSLGAVTLLLVLGNHDTQNKLSSVQTQTFLLQLSNQTTITEAADAQRRAAELERYAADLPKTPKPQGLSATQERQLMPHTVAKNLVILLDLSGA